MSANSIYALLNYPSNDPVMNAAVQPFSANVQYQMNLMPSMVKPWQQNDIAANNTTGYFQNPTLSQSVWDSANSFLVLTSTCQGGNTGDITTLINSTISVAQNMSTNTANNYVYHTNRMSNVIEPDVNGDLPHYQTAIGYGKMITYITNKTDGVQNNSVLLGSFGSILSANLFNANAIVVMNWTNYFANTLYDDGTGNLYSNISLTDSQSMYTAFASLDSEMWNRRQQDINFFTNTKTVMDRYNHVNQFNNIGQTESDLIMNHIGTDKIKTRLSS